jgi:hypothetical protein
MDKYDLGVERRMDMPADATEIDYIKALED